MAYSRFVTFSEGETRNERDDGCDYCLLREEEMRVKGVRQFAVKLKRESRLVKSSPYLERVEIAKCDISEIYMCVRLCDLSREMFIPHSYCERLS